MRSMFDTGKAGNQLVFTEKLYFRVLIPSILLKTELSLRYNMDSGCVELKFRVEKSNRYGKAFLGRKIMIKLVIILITTLYLRKRLE